MCVWGGGGGEAGGKRGGGEEEEKAKASFFFNEELQPVSAATLPHPDHRAKRRGKLTNPKVVGLPPKVGDQPLTLLSAATVHLAEHPKFIFPPPPNYSLFGPARQNPREPF